MQFTKTVWRGLSAPTSLSKSVTLLDVVLQENQHSTKKKKTSKFDKTGNKQQTILSAFMKAKQTV
jgi:hypothetical protein